ncbi:TobH protein [Mycobacterium sp. NPDC006124]|uniref:TobH protein n=1 Tax=Mycobacterium sp. NPDC006124 TaxID=3156729 RepID=UPI0033BC8F95
MSAPHATVDLDDVEGLLAADREGLLRAASMAGAHMRATAAALDEGALASLAGGHPPRTVIWVATRGAAEAAGDMLAAALGGSTRAPIVVASEVPPWIGALDVMIVAGDDAADPVLVNSAASGIRRGARVVVAAPDEGPLREVAAGRAVVLAPRLQLSDEFGLVRYLAVGLAVLHVVLPGMSADLSELADALDAETLRNSASRDVFTNPAKSLADRMSDRDVVLAGGTSATVALARHAGSTLLRVAQQPAAAVGLADAMAALRRGLTNGASTYESSIFHDDDIDGPLGRRVRAIVFATDEERPAMVASLSGYDDVDVLSADDVPDGALPRPTGRREQQLAVLAVRFEMAAVYLRLARG